MKWLHMTLGILACFLSGGPAQAQVDSLTIEVEGVGVVRGVGHDCPINSQGRIRGYVGTIECPVWVVDIEGQRTLGSIEVRVTDTTQVRAEVRGDSILVLEILRKKEKSEPAALVTLIPHPLILSALHNLTTDVVDTIPPFSWQAGDVLHWCAYRGDSYAQATMVSAPGEAWVPPCPTFGQGELPTFPVFWTGGGSVLRWHQVDPRGSVLPVTPAYVQDNPVMARVSLPVQRLALIRSSVN